MKINKSDLYIDYSISGNTLWYASEAGEDPNYILIASFGSDMWNELFPKIHINNNSINSKELLKLWRKKWLEQELKKLNNVNEENIKVINEGGIITDEKIENLLIQYLEKYKK